MKVIYDYKTAQAKESIPEQIISIPLHPDQIIYWKKLIAKEKLENIVKLNNGNLSFKESDLRKLSPQQRHWFDDLLDSLMKFTNWVGNIINELQAPAH